MFQVLDEQTKDMLTSSGELQRAYLLTVAFQEAYDAYMVKFKDAQTGVASLHESAEGFAYLVIQLVFGGYRS